MDELLAYAAAHKSTFDLGTRQRYLFETTKLQTRALKSYNCVHKEISEANCLPIFIFTSLMSHHIIFCLTLVVHDGLDALIDYLTFSIEILRGLIAIARMSLPMFSEQVQDRLMRSCQCDFAPIPRSSDSRGECDVLLTKLYTADLEPATMGPLCRAVEILQDRFDTVHTNNSHAMWVAAQDWPAAIPEDYIQLLNAKQPEALVVLAYFAVLLHHVAEHWFVGDLGIRLICLMSTHLGTDWENWMEWPIRTKMGYLDKSIESLV